MATFPFRSVWGPGPMHVGSLGLNEAIFNVGGYTWDFSSRTVKMSAINKKLFLG